MGQGNVEQRRSVSRLKRGQSTLEYILIIAGIVAAVAWAAGALILPAVNQSMNDSANTITSASNKLAPGLGL